ncbi:hypothetical protein E6C76_13125 [Pseudothauera nasutitermitis]|uniref:Uncharacterized protein n=1 Tax=Pseudothauera nasutitermitis TaxID=2565930 RepID=A0A4S4AXZ9_9RHOO|nr:hypothetical protein [Pseudothauera nasutitermitis]THF64964.1 hypothetical protein E6C76_13125 [Pseudothauera nasutitermitis]
MITFKEVLCLLAVFVAYGIAGHLDYEDALRLERIRQERLYADCPATLPAGGDVPLPAAGPPLASPGREAGSLHDDGRPCLRPEP